MPEPTSHGAMPSFSRDEIVALLSRYRRMIVAFSLCGAIGAAAIYLMAPRAYQSEARLMVRYVTESSLLPGENSGDRVISPNLRGQSIINSEAEIFSSRGIAEQVAKAVGPATITGAGRDNSRLRRWGLRLPDLFAASDGDGATDPGLAALMILENLSIEVPNRSNVIKLYYSAPTPILAQDVLDRLIAAYLQKHYEVHRGGDAYEFLSQQTDQLKSRLHETENELRRQRQEAGVISTDETKKSLTVGIEDLRRQLRDCELVLAEAKAGFVTSKADPARDREDTTTPRPERTGGTQAELEALCSSLLGLRDRERQLLATYTPDSAPVKNVRQQITELEQRLEQDYPGTTLIDMPGSTQDNRVSVVQRQTAKVAGTEAKADALRQQLQELQEQARRVDNLEAEIRQLERKKELEENNYLYFSRSLEKARIDDALSLSKVSNISIVQEPTLPVLPSSSHTLHKMLLVLILGVGAGLGLAFVSEYAVDHSLRDPATVREILQKPVLAAIPFAPPRRAWLFRRKRGRARLLPVVAEGEAQHVRQTAWDVQYEHDAYFEDVRDRLLGAINRTPGKPYLIGVTSGSPRGGTACVAAGLALFLSRNGDGRVLLIDADLDPAGAQGLSESHPAQGVIRPLTGKGKTANQSDLFLLVVPDARGELPQKGGAQVLSEFIDESRGTNYDFIIYRVPVVREMSPSLRTAGHMDGIIVVADVERERAEGLRQTQQLLRDAEATVLGAVLTRQC